MPGYDPTDEQRRILNHDPNHAARLLAGPGTGKSTTMVALVDSLLHRDNTQRIRFLTFTRAATSELAGKLVDRGASETLRPSTIHSFSISVLLRNPGCGGFPEPLRIADSWENDNIVRPTLARRLDVPVRTLNKLVKEMAANWQSLEQEANSDVTEDQRSRFLGAWDEHRRVYGYTLLDELPYCLRRALRDHDDLEGIEYDLIIVDEYQDLNACDLEVLTLLRDRGGCRIIGCGDDDQSIYSWRKAAPEGIRRFASDYPGSVDYPLSVTLRCGQRIIDWANYVIQGDPSRPRDRGILSCLPGSPLGEVAFLSFPGDMSEAKGVAALTNGLIEKEGLHPADILILMRSDYCGTFSRQIKEELAKLDITVSDPNYITSLLADTANRMALEEFRLLVNKTDSLAWSAILRLTTGIGHTFFEYVYKRCLTNGTTFAEELLSLYNDGFPDGPRSPSGKASDAILAVLNWLDRNSIPDERPVEGWGAWIIDASGGEVVSQMTGDFATLLKDLARIIHE
ncbi:MAG: ATP-dependent helicase [Candidatus Zixiibacteriota bacterium]